MQLLAKNMAANKNTLRNFILKILLCMLILCAEIVHQNYEDKGDAASGGLADAGSR